MDFSYLKNLIPSIEEVQEGLQDLVQNIVDEIPSVQQLQEGIQNLNAEVRGNVSGGKKETVTNSFGGKKETVTNSSSNQKSLGFSTYLIPRDIMLFLFGWFDVFSLSQTLLVCRSWFFISLDNSVWKSVFQRDMYFWNVYQSFNEVLPSIWQPVPLLAQFFGQNKETETETENWRERYLLQYKFNNYKYKKYVKENTTPIINSERKIDMDPWTAKSSFNLNFSKKPFKLLFIGEGVVTTAKKLVYDMMWGTNTSFKMVSLFSGNSGIGSGVGFEVNKITLHVSSVRSDEEFLQKIKESEYIKVTQALVFVMDSNCLLEDIFEKLKYILKPELGISPDVPLLVLSCRINLEGDNGEFYPAEIAQQLKFEQLNRKWCISRVCESTLEGIYEGIDWLLSVLK